MEAITQWDGGGLFALTLTDKKGTIRKKFPDSLQSLNASVCLSSCQTSSPKSFGECHHSKHYQFLHSSQQSPHSASDLCSVVITSQAALQDRTYSVLEMCLQKLCLSFFYLVTWQEKTRLCGRAVWWGMQIWPIPSFKLQDGELTLLLHSRLYHSWIVKLGLPVTYTMWWGEICPLLVFWVFSVPRKWKE